MGETVIQVENLWKEYRLGAISHRTLTRDLQSWWARMRGKEDPNSQIGLGPSSPAASGAEDRFWALREVSFEIRQGDVFGIIGRNGAGKSTLLKILSQVTTPTRGEVRYNGRIASLLEVGTGFHPELSGRENIFLNGAILGMSKQDIRLRFDQIVAFAEVGKFIDTPVKRYSSGMYVRLAFAVAAHLEPEILVVDEVLAVGDARFQKKCLGKMEEAGREGRTVLFVSHNMGALVKLCTRAILIESGRVVLDATPEQAIKKYLEEGRQGGILQSFNFAGNLSHILKFDVIRINGIDQDSNYLSPASEINIAVSGRCSETIRDFRTTFSIFTEDTQLVTQHDTQFPETLQEGNFTAEVTIPAFFLRPGEYSIAIGGYRDGMNDAIWGTYLKYFTVTDEWNTDNDQFNYGVVNVPFNGRRVHFPRER